MTTISLFIVSVAAVTALGCGSSVDPEQPKNDLPPVTTPPDNEPLPTRTLIQRSVLSGSPQNLLLNIGFSASGWGHFTTFFDGAYSPVQITTRTFSRAPESVTAPVGIFKDPAADDTKSKAMTSVCSFLGGKGPFIARIWVSRSNVAGEPSELADDPAVFRAALTTGGLPEGKAYDLSRKEEKVIGGRTWQLFEARVDAELPSTSFFTLRFGRRGGGFMVTAPEVVALGLMPPGDSKMSLSAPHRARAVSFEEGAAIGGYLRQPHRLTGVSGLSRAAAP